MEDLEWRFEPRDQIEVVTITHPAQTAAATRTQGLKHLDQCKLLSTVFLWFTNENCTVGLSQKSSKIVLIRFIQVLLKS
jgi:hypothetical protein